MSATIEIKESNESSGEALTTATTTDYGSVDSPNLDVDANPLAPSTNSYEKQQRLHVTAMGGSAAVLRVKLFATAPGNATGITQFCNGHVTQGTYDTSKRTVYAAPVTTTGGTPNAMPTSEPGSANIGIGGSLTGQLTATGYSDYMLHQVRVGASPTHADTNPIDYTVYYGWSETL
jgi:hypothetical protein